jgi:hypothetical protein
VEQLRGDLSEIGGALDFAALSASLRGQINGMLRWEGLDQERKRLAQEFMRSGQSSLEGVARGLFVNIAGSYEEFLRRLIRGGVETLVSNAKSFDEVPEGPRNHNMHWTGNALRSVFKQRSYARMDLYRVCSDIGTCIPGNRDFRLNSEALSLEITLPTSEGLDRILERIGIDKYWDDLGRDRGLQRALGAGGVREASRLVGEWVDTFVERRNLVVHGSRDAVIILEADVREALRVVEALGVALGNVVIERLDG